jgi:hypothetical protein
MKTDLKKMVAIAGYPGLFRYLSQNNKGIIVESLIDGKRMHAGISMRVTTLGEMAIYTDTEELPLKKVFETLKEQLHGAAAINHKSDADTLRRFFDEAIPNYDKERFYPSHMKKVVEWYNLLQKNDMLDFTDDEAQAPAPQDTAADA